jgi:hypothetical protein
LYADSSPGGYRFVDYLRTFPVDSTSTAGTETLIGGKAEGSSWGRQEAEIRISSASLLRASRT